MRYQARHRAFTVVELLVVVLIIIVLISIMFPALARAREVARRAACANHARNLGLGIIAYANETDIMPSTARNLCAQITVALDVRDAWQCGSDLFLGAQSGQCSYGANADRTGTGSLPEAQEAGWVEPAPGGGTYGQHPGPFSGWYKGGGESLVHYASVAPDTILLGESWREQVNDTRLDDPSVPMFTTAGPNRDSLLLIAYTSTDHLSTSPASPGPFAFMIDVGALAGRRGDYSLDNLYHAGRANVLLGDGHVEAMRMKRLCAGADATYANIGAIPYWNRLED